MHRSHLTRLVLGLGLLAALAALSAVLSSALASSAPMQASGSWQDISLAASRQASGAARQELAVNQGRYLRLDQPALQALLSLAPLEAAGGGAAAPAGGAAARGLELSLPLPDGASQRFRIVEAPIMEPALAAKFPEITTFAGQGLDDPAATLRLDWTPQGFHAVILREQGTVYIEPLYQGRTDLYVAYNKFDLVIDPQRMLPELPPIRPDGASAPQPGAEPAAPGPAASHGTQLRTYRLAVAATGEYTQFHGGTVPLGLAAVVTAVNRVNAIYEREVAVRLVLVANNNLVIYTNPNADPYTNDNSFFMMTQNQTTLDAVIGSANYDVGHVFSTGGGGVAALQAPCNNGFKAEGVTGLPAPTGDAFWVDFVAHEMGHQFSAEHSFNGNAVSCSGGNRNAATAYEPGSGSTIMGYAGICGTQNLQPNSDDYFHSISFSEIVAFTTTGSGSSCAAVTSTGNQPPTILSGSGGYTIPALTPFRMTGTASDPNGDALTYQWEQFNLGPAGAPPGVAGYVTPPHFRSFNPTSGPARTFPRMQDVVNNTVSVGEILPATSTTLNFRFSVRDNRSAGGGVANGSYAVAVTNTAGPFQVTAPNSAVTWPGLSTQTVTWNVAGTDAAPVSCTKVDISLSTDGGFIYPILLQDDTPNDGSAAVVVPNTATTNARIQVSCADNIFFDISNTNFTIQLVPVANLTLAKSAAPDPLYAGQPLTYTLTVTNTGTVTLNGIVVTDTLPLSVTYQSDTAGCTILGGVPPVAAPTVLRCDLPDPLTAGASQSFQVLGLAPSQGVTVTNQAQAAFDGTDIDPADNQVSLDTWVQPSSDLALSMTGPAAPVAGLTPVTYTLTISNAGPSTAAGVLLTDTLPAGAAFAGASPGCTAAAGQVTCALASLAPQAAQVYTLTLTTPGAALTLANQAQVAADTHDPLPANNQTQLALLVQWFEIYLPLLFR